MELVNANDKNHMRSTLRIICVRNSTEWCDPSLRSRQWCVYVPRAFGYKRLLGTGDFLGLRSIRHFQEGTHNLEIGVDSNYRRIFDIHGPRLTVDIESAGTNRSLDSVALHRDWGRCHNWILVLFLGKTERSFCATAISAVQSLVQHGNSGEGRWG